MKVSVLMPTYNHETTISQAVESFLAQKCTFEIELWIGNDASPDKTLQIVEKYEKQFPEKIKIINHPTNLGLLKNYQSLINASTGEYFAILESDDYWISDDKLQHQIDFLDAHTDYGISVTRWKSEKKGELIPCGDSILEMTKKYPSEIYERFLLRNILKSPTVCFRRSVFEQYCNVEEYINAGFKTFDYPVWLSVIRHSRFHFLDETTAVYRFMDSSISNTKDINRKIEFEENIEKIRVYIIGKYGLGTLKWYQIRIRETIVKARIYFRFGRFGKSTTTFFSGLWKAIF